MIEWLKTSIPGLILLGAVGSMLAVGILKLAVVCIRRAFAPAFHSATGRVFTLFRASHYIVEHLRESDDPRELIVTCMIVLAGFFFDCICMAMGFLFFAIGIATIHAAPTTNLGSSMAFFGSFFTFFSMFNSTIGFRDMCAIYKIHMKSAEEKAKASAAAEFSGQKQPN